MEITEVRVRKVNSGNRVKAIAQITFDNEFVVHEIKVMEKPEGLFIAMPRRKKGERYYDIAHPINQEVRDKLTKAVLEKYEEAEDPEPVEKTESERGDFPFLAGLFLVTDLFLKALYNN